MKINPKIKAALIIMAITSFFIGLVAAAGYFMQSPPSDPQTVTTPSPAPSASPEPTAPPQATLSKVTFPTSSLTVGATTTLTTTVSDATAGITVTFRDQYNDAVAYATTDASGTATCAPFAPPVGTWIYHATANHP
jgi:hypothetical protein